MPIGVAQTMTEVGLGVVYSTPLATEQVLPDTGLFLHVKNANASACNVTVFDASVTPAGSAAVNTPIAVPATTGDRMIPIDPRTVNQSTGLIQVTFSVTASVTAALVRR